MLPFLRETGSFRLLLLFSFTSSLLAGYLPALIKKEEIILIIVLICVGSTILNWGQRTMVSTVTDQSLMQNLPYSTAQGEHHFYANSRWINLKHQWFEKPPASHIEIVSGKASIKSLSRTATTHAYSIKASTNLVLVENTLYFPGWSAMANNKNVPIAHTKNGIITFKLKKGTHDVSLHYQDLQNYKLTKVISAFSFAIIAVYLAFSLFQWFSRKNK